MNPELGKIREEIVVAYFKIVSQNFRKGFRIVIKTLRVSSSVEILTVHRLLIVT
jgi:D-alanine-D-alanine ligase-like ATP-grasp enzyme